MSEIAFPAPLRFPPLHPYPERMVSIPDAVERAVVAAQSVVVTRFARWRARRLAAVIGEASRHDARLRGLDDASLRREGRQLRRGLRAGPRPCLADIAHAFALVREASARTLGLRHHDVQLIGAHALVRGMVAEMDTGEGKTLTAALAAITMALAGVPVHVVTVNDYLAGRDADKLAPLYAFFGLTVGTVVEGLEPQARRAAYGCDVTYCTNKELAFDYLKDRLVFGQKRGALHLKLGRLREDAPVRQLLLRGLHFAIVDEADSVFVDEARTPLILSRNASSRAEAETCRQAIAVASDFEEPHHFRLHAAERRIEITPAGLARLKGIAGALGGPWLSRIHREHLVLQALSSLHLMKRDEDYIVRDGKVQIIDEYTGRVMADRFWNDGLHQMVETKEACEISGQRLTLGRMTYQRFFRRYRLLSGMTGTGREIAGELWRVYRLAVVRIPPHRPSRRTVLPDQVATTADEKWRQIALHAQALAAGGIPVLIGTRSVASADQMSASLTTIGVAHVVLNAVQDEAEADIIARAGAPGQVTVATNIAGRGTDIRIDEGVAASGGLYVIMSERHDSRRIDRQLGGRCARQGQPGVFRAMLSLDDAILANSGLRIIRATARLGGRLVRTWALRYAQRRAERLHARMRRDLLRSDERLDHALAFSGKSE